MQNNTIGLENSITIIPLPSKILSGFLFRNIDLLRDFYRFFWFQLLLKNKARKFDREFDVVPKEVKGSDNLHTKALSKIRDATL